MLKIGTLSTKVLYYTASTTADTFGQITPSLTEGESFFCRVEQRKIDTAKDASARTYDDNIDIVCRYNPALLDYSLVLLFADNQGAKSGKQYTIEGIEELGRKEGLKIGLVRKFSQNSN